MCYERRGRGVWLVLDLKSIIWGQKQQLCQAAQRPDGRGPERVVGLLARAEVVEGETGSVRADSGGIGGRHGDHRRVGVLGGSCLQ